MPRRSVASAPVLGLLVALAAAPLAAAGPASEQPDLDRAVADLATAGLRPERAVAVERLAIDAGPGRLELERGLVVPAVTETGGVTELVFVGRGRFAVAPPDEIEADQLEIFTGRRRLDEEIDHAVLVVGNDEALARILARPTLALRTAGAEAVLRTDGDAERIERAQAIYRTWRSGPVRRHSRLDARLVEDRLDEPRSRGFFLASFHSPRLGDFLLSVDPARREQVHLGRFVPPPLSREDQRRIELYIDRQQRRGRLTGVSPDDLGLWETWISASLGAAGDEPAPGHAGFEPGHYEITAELDPRRGSIAGRARIDLIALAGGHRSVSLRLAPELAVTAVEDGLGRPLPHYRSQDEVLVRLAEAPAPGSRERLAVTYRGRGIEKAGAKAFQLAETVAWHPHVGAVDRATYDVTLRWPARYDLLAAGRRIDGGEDAGVVWERRVIDRPAAAFGFEIGRYRTVTAEAAGRVEIVLGIEEGAYRKPLGQSRFRLLKTLVAAVEYYEEVFGPYPHDRLVVATSRRLFSQALPGFMTLSAFMMSDEPVARAYQLEDRRTVIAHEVAHQWWGHQVGFESYRDLWISEGMASYASILFARARLEGGDLDEIGPTRDWQRTLGRILPSGRAVEAMGPIVLGTRLDSSQTPDGVKQIVYTKGALVLDMLARLYGEERFLAMLREVGAAVDHRVVSTDTFLALLERLGGRSLDGFAETFLYGTGRPALFFDYRFEPTEDGRWRVAGEAEVRPPTRFRHRLTLRPDGRLDLERRRETRAVLSAPLEQRGRRTELVIPFELQLREDVGGRASAPAGEASLEPASAPSVAGRVLLRSPSTPLLFETDRQPAQLWLDRGGETFGRFFDQRRVPKRSLYHLALDRADRGEDDEAVELCRRALAAAAVGESAEEARLLDGSIELLSARLALDRGDGAEARRALDQARRLVSARERPSLWRSLRLLEARLALADGEARSALELLRRGIDRGELGGAEPWLLLAIAAYEVGEPATRRTALAEARALGADVTVMEAIVRRDAARSANLQRRGSGDSREEER